ncbi:MAG: YkgB family protein [Pseudomonadota bacterium]|nr:YkgB family protein [Pseudomonadota bacterium]
MTDATFANPYAAYPASSALGAGARIESLGEIVMRCGLALIFLWFGAMKFTSVEAAGVAGFVSNSPLVGWWHAAFSIQGTSDMLGVYEIATGVLLLAGFSKPWLSVIGGAMGVITFLITLSFLFSTPGGAEPLAGGFPAISAKPGQFLLKDVGLLGISIFVLGASLVKAQLGEARGALGAQILRIGGFVLRYGLALIFLWFGCMKFTAYEATGIAPFIANSPLVGWWHVALGIQGASVMIGLIEIATAVLLALRPVAPLASVVGGAMAVVSFLITFSFFFTTPGVGQPLAGGFPAISSVPGQFLLKDIGLLGASIWLLGDALLGWSVRRGPTIRASAT